MALRTVGKYQLVEKISEGGMGELYRASAEGPGGFQRDVALKIIRRTVREDDQFVQMFVEEAKIASMLSHANLVHLYDFGSDGDSHYLCLELVVGKDFAGLLARCKIACEPLSVGLSMFIVEQVALGLHYAHQLVNPAGQPLRLVHRDVSPQNILISYDGEVKLTDFGIAKVQRVERLTQSGVIKGKLRYMSPEQASTGALDRRSDVFGLGLVLWEALSSKKLFDGTSDALVLNQILHESFRPPSVFNDGVSPALDALVMRALERNPRRRFQTAREFAVALADLGRAERRFGDSFALATKMRRLFLDGRPSPKVEPPAQTALTILETDAAPTLAGPPAPPPLPTLVEAEAPTVPKAPPEPAEVHSVVTLPDSLGKARFYGRPAAVWVGLLLLGGLVASGFALRRGAPRERVVEAEVPAPPLSVVPAPSLAVALGPVPEGVAAPTASAPLPAPVAAPKPKPKAVPRPALRAGNLMVVSVRPWVEVWVDRVNRGYSPNRTIPVSAGRHRVTLSNPDADLERHFSIEVPAGGQVVFRGDLRSLEPTTEE